MISQKLKSNNAILFHLMFQLKGLQKEEEGLKKKLATSLEKIQKFQENSDYDGSDSDTDDEDDFSSD